MKKLTAEEVQSRIDASKTVHLHLLEPYEHTGAKILVRCETCLHERCTTGREIQESIKNRTACCPKCSKAFRGLEQRKTNEQYVEEIKDRPFKSIEAYITNNTKIKHKCNICDTIWQPLPNSILQGKGCPKCAAVSTGDKQRKRNVEYIEEIKDRPLAALDSYINSRAKIKHQCNICDNIWEARPNDILQGSGCPKCANVSNGENQRKSNTEYIEEIKGRPFKVIELYITNKTKIKHQCNICDNIWEAQPSDILSKGSGCPNCAKVVSQVHWEGERDESLKTTSLKIPLSLYILDSEDCIKVGITNNVARRVTQLNRVGFKCTLLREYKLNAWDAIMVEQDIHKDFKRYTGPIKFNGYKELHYTEDLDIIKGFIEKKTTTIVT